MGNTRRIKKILKEISPKSMPSILKERIISNAYKRQKELRRRELFQKATRVTQPESNRCPQYIAHYYKFSYWRLYPPITSMGQMAPPLR